MKPWRAFRKGRGAFHNAWRALRNMVRAAGRDPVWAISAISLNLFRAARYVFGTALAGIVVLFVLALVANWITGKLGFKAGSPVHIVLMLIAAAVAALFVLRRATAPMIRHFGDQDGDTHGTARFATAAECRPLTQASTSLLIGRDPATRKLLRYDGPSHLLTMAPTRTGKGVGTVIPNLLTANRSVICIDPKGENTRIAYRARARFGPVHVLDPFGITGQPSSCFNPLAAFDPAGLDLAEDVATLADALVCDAPGETGEVHWNEEAKALIAGLLLLVVTEEPPPRRTLARLREHLTCPPAVFDGLLAEMQASIGAGGLIARFANRFAGKTRREASGVLSTAQRHTHFLDSPRMTAVLERSDFAFADLKTPMIARIWARACSAPPLRRPIKSQWQAQQRLANFRFRTVDSGAILGFVRCTGGSL